MKGVIFTEFANMIDEKFSPELMEAILDDVDIPSGGAYTTVGDYDHGEILALVSALSRRTETDVPALVRAFGFYLFSKLGQAHPEYIKDVPDAFAFLEKVHDHIHVEVKKLYPNAKVPDVLCERISDGEMVIKYSSDRPFADVAEGLIAGCIEYFGAGAVLRRTAGAEDGTSAEFQLKRAA
ncbi:MAG: heme NO-binding domain-containing protein [Pseudomonadota bacterium]